MAVRPEIENETEKISLEPFEVWCGRQNGKI